MNCPRCGRPNAETSTRCTVCGADLSPDSDSETFGGVVPVPLSSKVAAAAARAAVATPPPVAGDEPTSGPWNFGAPGAAPAQVNFGPRYKIERLLGEGGMGAVYKAYDLELDRTVALKLIRPGIANDPLVAARFKQELLLASRISHKNILRIHDLGEAAGTKFISMAYVEGTDLHGLLTDKGKLPLERAVNIAKQLCAALDAAHSEGVVHRDFKPQNILLDAADHVYVSDFGLAKSLETDAGMTRSGEMLGTPRYMAPEQVLGKGVDHRVDIYALGLILYEMVTGDVPFHADSTIQLMYMRVHEVPKSPKVVNPELPDWLVQTILKCIDRDPAQRYQGAAAVLHDLENGTAPKLAPAAPGQTTVSLTMPRRWLVPGLVLALALLAALGYLVVRKVAGPSRGPAATQGMKGKYLAILPFKVLGDEKSLRYAADGLSGALAAKMFHLQDVHLASESAVASVDRSQPLPAIAHSLGVNLVADGMIQGAGDKIRIVVNLTDVQSGKTLWTDEFSGVTQDLLTLEDQIYAKLVNALELKPTSEQMAAGASHPTENVAAYDLYLRGRDAVHSEQNIGTLTTAIKFYEDALKADPKFALAYAGLADASIAMYHEKKDRFWSERALAAGKQAEEINPNLPEVHFTLGMLYSETGRTAEAVEELKSALRSAPNSDDGYRRLGNVYQAMGRSQEALQAYEKAVEINPYYWRNHNALGLMYYALGASAKSEAEIRKVIELEPGNADGYNNLASILLQSGYFEKAIAPLEKSVQLAPTGDSYSNLGVAYSYMRQFDKAITYYQKAVELVPNSVVFVGNLAEVLHWAGRKQEAEATYEKAIALAYKDLQVNPRSAGTMAALGLWYAEKGDFAKAQQFIRQARQIDPTNVDFAYYNAQVLALSGNSSEALNMLREAFQKGAKPAIAAAEPNLERLRSQAAFGTLLKEFGR